MDENGEMKSTNLSSSKENLIQNSLKIITFRLLISVAKKQKLLANEYNIK